MIWRTLIFLILLLISVNLASSLSLNDAVCDDGFSLVAYAYTDFEKNDWAVSINGLPVEGIWTDYQELNPGMGGYLFESTNFTETGNFQVKVKRKLYNKAVTLENNTHPLIEQKSSTVNITCLPQTFRCAKADINVSCTTINSVGYILFKGINQDFSLENLSFNIIGAEKSWLGVMPENSNFSVWKRWDMITFPVGDTKLDTVELSIKNCDSRRYKNSRVRVNCHAAQRCTANFQCDDGICSHSGLCNPFINGTAAKKHLTDSESKPSLEAAIQIKDDALYANKSSSPDDVGPSSLAKFIDWLRSILNWYSL